MFYVFVISYCKEPNVCIPTVSVGCKVKIKNVVMRFFFFKKESDKMTSS